MGVMMKGFKDFIDEPVDLQEQKLKAEDYEADKIKNM